MPNVILTKDDGLTLIAVPADVVAILSAETDRNPDHPDAKCCIFSTFRGFSIFFLQQTAMEAFALIAGSDDSGREFLELPTPGGDAHYIQPSTVRLAEGVKLPSGDQGLRVWFTRPGLVHQEGANQVYADAAFSQKLLETVTPLIGGGAAPAEPIHNKPAARSRKK